MTVLCLLPIFIGETFENNSIEIFKMFVWIFFDGTVVTDVAIKTAKHSIDTV